MAASYPTAVVSLPTRATGQTITDAFFNLLHDEITAIEQGLLNGIDHVLRPLTDLTRDLGTSSFRWRDIFGRQLDLASGASASRQVLATYAAADANPFEVSLRKARGTIASPAVVVLNDILGQMNFYGHTGSAYYQSAAIRAFAMENWSGTAGGSDMEFYTTRTGQQILRLRLRILGGIATSHQFLNSDGTQIATLEHTAASGETVLFLSYHNGAAVVNQRVTVGATDSGGAGFKLLRVPNT